MGTPLQRVIPSAKVRADDLARVEASRRPDELRAQRHRTDRRAVKPRDVEERARGERARLSGAGRRPRDLAARHQHTAQRRETPSATKHSMLRCVLIAPSGDPWCRSVNSTIAGSSSADRVIRQRRPGVVPREGCEVVLHDERPHARMFAARGGRAAAGPRSGASAPTSRCRARSSSPCHQPFRPTAIAPRLVTAQKLVSHSGLFAPRSAMRSPGPMSKPFAQRPGPLRRRRGGARRRSRGEAVVEDVVVERVEALRVGQQLAEARRPVAKHGHGFAAHRFDRDFEHPRPAPVSRASASARAQPRRVGAHGRQISHGTGARRKRWQQAGREWLLRSPGRRHPAHKARRSFSALRTRGAAPRSHSRPARLLHHHMSRPVSSCSAVMRA